MGITLGVSRDTCTVAPVVNAWTTAPIVCSSFRRNFAHLPTRVPLDLLSHFVSRVRKQLAMKLLHLGGTLPARAFSAGVKASCKEIISVSSLRTAFTALGA